MVTTHARVIFEQPHPGRCKRFDFLYRPRGVGIDAFRDVLEASTQRQAGDAGYRNAIDRQIHFEPIETVDLAHALPDLIRSLSATSFERLDTSADGASAEWCDMDRSFSVFATEFVMQSRC